MSEPDSDGGSSDATAWGEHYTSAQLLPPKSAEMIEALDLLWAKECGYARAAAALNGGEFDKARLRRVAALEAALRTLERVSEGFGEFPKKVKEVILGKTR